VPLEKEPPRLVEEAGFQKVQLLKFDAKPCFVRDGIAMREMQLVGWKLADNRGDSETVLYKGPFRQIVDDQGTVYLRGQRTRVDAATYHDLRRGALSEHFLFFVEPGREN
jgi:hypothetical protein